MITTLHAGFKVKDFDQWKKGYDAHIEQRKAGSGEMSFKVFRNVSDPNTVTVLSEHRNLEQVKAFFDSPDLQNAMEEAGISEMGLVLYMEEMDKG